MDSTIVTGVKNHLHQNNFLKTIADVIDTERSHDGTFSDIYGFSNEINIRVYDVFFIQVLSLDCLPYNV